MPLVHEEDRHPTAEAMKGLYYPPLYGLFGATGHDERRLAMVVLGRYSRVG